MRTTPPSALRKDLDLNGQLLVHEQSPPQLIMSTPRLRIDHS